MENHSRFEQDCPTTSVLRGGELKCPVLVQLGLQRGECRCYSRVIKITVDSHLEANIKSALTDVLPVFVRQVHVPTSPLDMVY